MGLSVDPAEFQDQLQRSVSQLQKVRVLPDVSTVLQVIEGFRGAQLLVKIESFPFSVSELMTQAPASGHSTTSPPSLSQFGSSKELHWKHLRASTALTQSKADSQGFI